MSRWVLLAGVVVAVVVLYQFGAEKMTVNDVFQAVQIEREAAVPAGYPVEDVAAETAVSYFPPALPQKEPYQNSLPGPSYWINGVVFADRPRGAIIPDVWVDLMENTEFFAALHESRDVDSFVVLIENSDFYGPAEISLSKNGYETPFGRVKPDLQMINELLELDGVGLSNQAFVQDRSIKHIAAYLKMFFPEARIVEVAVRSSAGSDILDDFARALGEYDENDIMVLAASSLSADPFDQELYRSVFETSDVDGVGAFDANNRVAVRLLLSYLAEVEAQEFEFYNDHVVNFFDGEAGSNERALTVLAFGDVMLGRYVRTLMDEHGKDYIFAGLDRSFFEGADVVAANLEGPIKGEGRKGGTSMIFSFNEDIAPFLKSYGFDLFSIANNHANDQGLDGRESTITALQSAGLWWCGHPNEVDQAGVYYGTVGDKSYAFVCFHDVTHKLDDVAAVELVKNVAAETDYVLVSIHWGYEYKHKPDLRAQIEPGRAFVDAGADFVIGHHPHVVQPFEVYKGKFIFYSLGNFVFDQFWSNDTQEELAIGIVLREDSTRVYLFPMKSRRSQSYLMRGEELREWTERFIGYWDYNAEMQKMIREGLIMEPMAEE